MLFRKDDHQVSGTLPCEDTSPPLSLVSVSLCPSILPSLPRSLPPFLPQDLSDYSSHKIKEDNLGFQMLKKAGWSEDAGLGANEDGITVPINKSAFSLLTPTLPLPPHLLFTPPLLPVTLLLSTLSFVGTEGSCHLSSLVLVPVSREI